MPLKVNSRVKLKDRNPPIFGTITKISHDASYFFGASDLYEITFDDSKLIPPVMIFTEDQLELVELPKGFMDSAPKKCSCGVFSVYGEVDDTFHDRWCEINKKS